jgi:predicted porin
MQGECMRSVRGWGAGFFLAISQIGLGSVPASGNDLAPASCCPELEVLLSELTGALTGTDKPERSVQIYGQLNRAIMYWDDGKKHGTYAIDNETSSSRVGVFATYQFAGDLKAGYRVEIDTRVTLSSGVSADDAVGDLSDGAIRLRHAYWFVEDGNLGRLTLGQQSPATNTITIINLGSQMSNAALHYNNDFGIWLRIGSGYITDLKWGQIAHEVDTLRGLFVRYDTPLMKGVFLSAAWGENGVWDVGARYQTEWGPFRFAGGVGYMDDPERSFRDIKGSASLIHDPTGLYASVAGGVRDDETSPLSANGLAHFHYIQLGISKQWLPYGKTTLYADYGLYKNFNVGRLLQADLVNPGQLVIWGTLAETEVQRWGIGAEQSFDKSGLLVYAQAHHYQARVVGFPCDIVPAPSPEACGGDPTNLAVLPTKPWFGFVAGVRIRF